VLWWFYFRGQIHDVRTERIVNAMRIERAALLKAGMVAALVLAGLLAGFPPAMVASIGAAILLITRTRDPHLVYEEVDRGGLRCRQSWPDLISLSPAAAHGLRLYDPFRLCVNKLLNSQPSASSMTSDTDAIWVNRAERMRAAISLEAAFRMVEDLCGRMTQSRPQLGLSLD